MKKKYFATLLCAAVLTAFTGCGESGALKEEKKAENKTEKADFCTGLDTEYQPYRSVCGQGKGIL